VKYVTFVNNGNIVSCTLEAETGSGNIVFCTREAETGSGNIVATAH